MTMSKQLLLCVVALLLVLGSAEETSPKHLRQEPESSSEVEAAHEGNKNEEDADNGMREHSTSSSTFSSWSSSSSSNSQTGKDGEEVSQSRTVEERSSTGKDGKVFGHRKETICNGDDCNSKESDTTAVAAKRNKKQHGSLSEDTSVFGEKDDLGAKEFFDRQKEMEKGFLDRQRGLMAESRKLFEDSTKDLFTQPRHLFDDLSRAAPEDPMLGDDGDDEYVMVPVRKSDLVAAKEAQGAAAAAAPPRSHSSRHSSASRTNVIAGHRVRGAPVPAGPRAPPGTVVASHSVSEASGLSPDGSLVYKVTECNGADCVTQVSTGRLASVQSPQVHRTTHRIGANARADSAGTPKVTRESSEAEENEASSRQPQDKKEVREMAFNEQRGKDSSQEEEEQDEEEGER